MLNRFNKAFFFTTLSLAVLMTLFSLIPALSYPYISFLELLCPVGDFQISALIAVLTPVGILLLSAFIALICALIGKWACRKKPAKPCKLGFYFFYLLAFASVSLIILLATFLLISPTDRAFGENYIFAFTAILLLSIVLSLVVAALVVSIVSTWKTNKTAAIIVMLVALVALFSSLIVVLFIDDKSYDRYSGEAAAYAADMERPAFSEGDYEGDGEGDSEGDYSEEPGYLSFLWESPDNDMDSVRYAMSYMLDTSNTSWGDEYACSIVDDGLVWAVFALDKKEPLFEDEGTQEQQRNARKIYQHLLANPSDIRTTFDSYKELFYSYMSYDAVQDTGVKPLLDALLAAHEDLYTDSNLSRLKKISTLMKSISHSFAKEYYNDILIHVNQDYLPRFKSDNEVCQELVVWAYSFWPRRSAQHNDAVVYGIVKEMSEYYNNQENYVGGD